MKRAHRKSHFIIWIVLAPILLWVIALAVLNRTDAPVNDSLPDALIEEAN